MGQQEVWNGRTQTFATSSASQGTDNITGQDGKASAVSRKPSPSAAAGFCCRPFVTAAQEFAEGQVKPSAKRYAIRTTNTRE